MADFKQVIAESIKTKVEDLTVEEIKGPVSYTHLDVYKRQGYGPIKTSQRGQ